MSTAEPALAEPERRPLGSGLGTLSGPVIGLLAVLGIFLFLIGIKGELGQFLSLGNLQVLVHESTIPAVLALGMLMVMVSGGIDLSVASVMSLVSIVVVQVYRGLYLEVGLPIPAASAGAVGCGLAAGAACGLTNGLVITRLKVSPFVTTLGMMGIAHGLAVWVSGRRTVPIPPEGVPGWVKSLATVHAGATVFDPGFWSLAALAVVVAVILRYTVLGRYCYAIGSNEPTARLCGVPIDTSKVTIYTIAGLLTGWAGVLAFAHGSGGDPNVGEGMELTVIAAVVIGGTSLTGGQGTVTGALLGVLILGVLGNGVSLFNVPVEIQYILIGVIIIANTALSHWQRARSGL
jgi:ribose transport system permease protein